MGIRKFLGGLQASCQAKLYNLSDDHKAYLSSGGKCPNCKYQLNPRFRISEYIAFFSVDHKQIPLWKFWKLSIWSVSYLRCLKCGREWFPRNVGRPVAVSQKVRIIEFIETNRIQERIGDDCRLIDNSLSPAAMTRKFAIIREWSKSYVIEYEKTDSSASEILLGINDSIGTRTATEKALREQYSVSEERKESVAEEVEITVPAHTKLGIVFQWKRVWQNGFIKLVLDKDIEIAIPYRIALSISFDQVQYDGDA